jgi:hypothetical protein
VVVMGSSPGHASSAVGPAAAGDARAASTAAMIAAASENCPRWQCGCSAGLGDGKGTLAEHLRERPSSRRPQ